MSKKVVLLLVVLLAGAAFLVSRYSVTRRVVPDTAVKHVYILLGQSNMDGYGKWIEYPESMRVKRKDILIVRNGRWVPMVPDQKYNGPEISFAHEMKKAYPEDIIGIIKVSAGGAGIRAFIPNWSEENADISEDAYHGPLYKKLKQQIDYVKSDPNAIFCGILWKQGEKDAIKKIYAEGYLDYLKEIVEQIRQDTGVSDLPLFIGTYYDIETTKMMLDKGVYSDREAALDISVAHNKAPEVIENTYVVRHGTLPVISDGVHFTTNSLVRLGEMFSAEVVKQCSKAAQNNGEK